MKKFNLLFIFGSFVFLNGCLHDNAKTGGNEKTKSNIEIFSFADTITPVELDSYQFFDSIRYVRLETTDSSFLSQIKSVILIKDRFFIHDRRLKKLVLFDMDGKFVLSINSSDIQGNDFRDIQCIAKFGLNKVIVLDNINKRVGFLSSEGRLLSWVSINGFPISIAEANNSICLFRTTKQKGEHYLLKVIDSTGEILPEFNINANIIKRTISSPIKYFTFYDVADSSFLFSSDSNCVFKITNKGINMTKKISIYSSQEVSNDLSKPMVLNYVETNSFVFADLAINRLQYNFIYDKERKKTILLKPFNSKVIHLFGLKNRHPLSFPIWPTFKLNNEWLCQIIDVSSLKKYQNLYGNYNGEKNMPGDDITMDINNMGAMSNPILLLLHVRNYENIN